MKFEEFQKLLGIPLDPKWEKSFIALHDYGSTLSRVNVGFLISPANEDTPEAHVEALERANEILRLIPPLYIVAGDEDGKRWVEQELHRNVQFVQGWYQSEVFLCVASIPLRLVTLAKK